jgi:ankyrin repeat protein
MNLERIEHLKNLLIDGENQLFIEIAQNMVVEDLNVTTDHDLTLLKIAVQVNNREIFEFLINKGVDIDSQDNYGTTALMFACGLGNEEFVRILLERGANTELVDNGDGYQVTAMDIARDMRKNGVIKLLEQNKESPFVLNLALENKDPGFD